jgi:hypothetical protein
MSLFPQDDIRRALRMTGIAHTEEDVLAILATGGAFAGNICHLIANNPLAMSEQTRHDAKEVLQQMLEEARTQEKRRERQSRADFLKHIDPASGGKCNWKGCDALAKTRATIRRPDAPDMEVRFCRTHWLEVTDFFFALEREEADRQALAGE